MQILDYSNAQIITINVGKAKIQRGYFKLIHVTEIGDLERTVNEIKLAFESHVATQHPLYFYIKHEVLQIIELINGLKPRREKRSLNFLGSTWKWIAGTPDHDDLITIKSKLNNLLENNNKQIIINKIHNDRVNEITNITNQILENIKNRSIIDNQSVTQIQYKLKLIKEEITNIKYAVHWAKLGIINPILLSQDEIKILTNILDTDHLPYTSTEEALDFSETKIITNGSCLFYIIRIPLTNENIYDNLMIKPIKTNNYVNQIEYNNILISKNEIYGIVKNCYNINFLTICKEENIVNIKNSTCIPKLLTSNNSTCKVNNHQHIPTIEEIDEGIILLNQFNGSITIDNKQQILIGTYLIKFHDTTITINGRNFSSKEISKFRILPPILQPENVRKEFQEHLSLELLKEIHINNTEQLELLKEDKLLDRFVSYSSVTLISIIAVIIVVVLCAKKRNKIIINTERKDVLTKEGGNKPDENPNPPEPIEIQPTQSQPVITIIPKVPRRKFFDSSML